MAIFSRLVDLLKANINDMIDKAEDPEKMLKLIVIEMEEHLAAATQGLGAAMASERQMRRRMEEAQENARAWEQRAKDALKAGDEALAKQAVENKLKADASAREREQEHAPYYAETEEMRVQLAGLKKKIDDTRAHQAVIIARVKMAKAKMSVAESLGGPMSKVSEIERKAVLAADTADAQYELSGLGEASESPGAYGDRAMEEELARLKKEINNQ
jgi:phage shock protein A